MRKTKYLKTLIIGNFYVYLFLIVFLFVGLLIAILLNTTNLIEDNFWGGVLVEASGFLLDILLFGLIISLYTKHQEIKGYKNEIEFFRGWKSEEGMLRTVGNIRLLNEEGFKNIDLLGCYLVNSNLEEVNLDSANLYLCNLERAQLLRSSFKSANLSKTNLKRAILSYTDFLNANFSGSDLQNSNLIGAQFIKSNLIGADLRGADCSGAYFWDANLKNANLSGSNLTNAKLNDANFEGTNLSGVNLLGASCRDINWIERLGKLNVYGYQEIKEKYKVVNTGERRNLGNGEVIYKIKLK